MTREEAKELFRKDVDSYGKPKAIMSKINKIYDDFDKKLSKILSTRQEVYITGGYDSHLPNDYFMKYLEENGIDPKYPKTFASIVEFECNDDSVHMLVIGNRTKAIVTNRRTDFNNEEFTFCSWK